MFDSNYFKLFVKEPPLVNSCLVHMLCINRSLLFSCLVKQDPNVIEKEIHVSLPNEAPNTAQWGSFFISREIQKTFAFTATCPIMNANLLSCIFLNDSCCTISWSCTDVHECIVYMQEEYIQILYSKNHFHLKIVSSCISNTKIS